MSASTTSMLRARAAWIASKITAAESPFSWLITVTLLRSPQTCSCSRAAARKVSPAASSTDVPLRLVQLGELADGGGLAGAVDAGQHEDEGLVRGDVERLLQRRQQVDQRLLQRGLQVGSFGQAFTPHLLLQGLEQGMGGIDADVGGDEDRLEFLEQLGVDLAADAKQAGQLAAEAVAGLGQTLLQPLCPAWARLGLTRFGRLRRGGVGLRVRGGRLRGGRFGLEETKHG